MTRRRARWALPLALVTAGVLGIAAGTLLRGDDAPRPAEAARTVSGGGLRLVVPPSWRVTDDAPSVEIAGASFERPIVLEQPKLGLRIVAERLGSAAPSLLPAGLEQELAAAPGKPTLRRLAGGGEAYAYAALVPRDGGAELRVHAAPTTAGVATIVCSASRPWTPTSAQPCDAVAASLEVPGAAVLPLGPETAFRASLPEAVAALVAARDDGRSGLAAARTARRQAVEAVQVGAAYRAAAAALSPLVVTPDGSPARTVEFLRRAGSKYDSLATAARSGDAKAYRTATAGIVSAEQRLDAIVAWLQTDLRRRLAAAPSRP